MGKETATAVPEPDAADQGPAVENAAIAGPATSDSAAVVQVALAEFGKLRDEIAGRSGTVWTLVGLNATVSSTVAGFVLASKADPLLLLLLPLLCPSLGLLVIDHATNIGNIGQYIDSALKPLLREVAGEPRLLSYEEWVDRFEEQPLRRLLPFGIPFVLLFSVVPVGALLYSATTVTDAWIWGLWGLGLLVTGVQVGFWVSFLLPPLRRALRATGT
jgi:hypothetical protein